MKNAFTDGTKGHEAAVQQAEQNSKTPEDIVAAVAKVAEQEAQVIEKGAVKCRSEHAKNNWNADAWDVGIAPTWTSATGKTDDIEHSGDAVWSSYAHGFKNAQLIMHTKYRTSELVTDPLDASAKIRRDSFAAGLRLRYGNERRSSLSLYGMTSNAGWRRTALAAKTASTWPSRVFWPACSMTRPATA